MTQKNSVMHLSGRRATSQKSCGSNTRLVFISVERLWQDLTILLCCLHVTLRVKYNADR